MGLILKTILTSKSIYVPERAVNVVLTVPKKFLSEPYELQDDAVIHGEILEIEEIGKEFKADEIIGKEIELILRLGYIGYDDWLYFSRDSWPLLRDYGILPEHFIITVSLKEIRTDEETVEIYPKRDVVV
ncbi:hypothetical protein CW696_05025 [ANME-2 cluster archaeon]|nr:MAG: hypothetical protein CW696_05025 [ANME-2 cluster archaeon]RLG25015.1 MAG: hypothetical protein DRN77_01050 [Methanosarcinales archaeon]